MNFWIRRVIIQEKRWITDEEYLEGLALGQILPGPNVYNLSLMLGYRFGGVRGAFAAIAGLVGVPVAFMVALGLLYQRYAEVPVLERALTGMTAVAAGLLLANVVGIANRYRAVTGKPLLLDDLPTPTRLRQHVEQGDFKAALVDALEITKRMQALFESTQQQIEAYAARKV